MKKRLFLLALPILGLTVLLATPLKAESGSLKILKFEADWCGACKQMRPVFASVAKEFGGSVAFQTVNVDKEAALTETYKVKYLPTFVAVKSGKVVGKASGVMSKEKLTKFIKKHQ